MGSRRKGRVLAVQTLFSWDTVNQDIDDLLTFSWLDDDDLEKLNPDVLMFARLLVSGTLEKIEDVDSEIKTQLEHWDFGRLSRVELSILRMSVYSIKYQEDIPASVTIDEAIDISKDYASDESYRFINGVLDGITKRLDTPEK